MHYAQGRGSSSTYDTPNYSNLLVFGLEVGGEYFSLHIAGDWQLSGGLISVEKARSCRSVGESRLSWTRAGRMVNLMACRVLFTSGGHFEVLTDIIGDLPYLTDLVVTDGTDEAKALFPSLTVRRFEDLLSDCEDHIPSQASDTDASFIMLTSGTTGPSKGCQLSHRYDVRTAENMIAPFRLTADDINYTPYPL